MGDIQAVKGVQCCLQCFCLPADCTGNCFECNADDSESNNLPHVTDWKARQSSANDYDNQFLGVAATAACEVRYIGAAKDQLKMHITKHELCTWITTIVRYPQSPKLIVQFLFSSLRSDDCK